MSTSLSLDAALSGLKAAQRQLDTISNNISNASTAGYTRKLLPTETLVVGGVGMGVDLNAIMRSVDKALIRDMMKQNSVSSGAKVESDFLSRIQSFHGASDAEASIAARIGELEDAFTDLSSAPDSVTQLSATLSKAQSVATTFNKYSQMILDMRNEAQDKISAAVTDVNNQLQTVAKLNLQIQQLSAQGNSTADLEDKRDNAIAAISQYMEVSTFTDSSNMVTVMTKQGQTLADGTARTLYFSNGNLGYSSTYPTGAAGLRIGSATGAEVTQGQIGGELGALFKLRDQTLPTYQAQMDEMAQKLSERLEQQGLRLFTNASGNVPASTAPPTPVGYVGYAAEIRINSAIIADPSLLRRGTAGEIVANSSNEVIRRVAEFGFGAYQYEEGRGTADISSGDLFTTLGLSQYNRINGNTDLTDYSNGLDQSVNINAPCSFTIDIGGGPQNVTINPGDTALDLVASINAALGGTYASLSGGGQLVLTTDTDITIGDVDLTPAGIQDLGLAFTTYPASDPSITVQVGTQSPINVTISAGDTAADLLQTLNLIPGLTASLGTNGELVLTPNNGGDLSVTDNIGNAVQLMGLTVTGVAQSGFRQTALGADGSLSSGLTGTGSIDDYARALLARQAHDAATAATVASDENTYLQTLSQRFSDQSGVDLDEEVAELVRVQTAYSAAARMITASEKMLDDLMQAI